MRKRWILIVAAMLAAIPANAWGLGADHPADQEVGGSSSWPAGLKELVNVPQRVHGYFVNWEDVFYFAGNTDRLNAFLVQYQALPGTKLQVVLHTGSPQVKSPWDKQPRNALADWKLYTTPFTEEQFEAAAREKDRQLKPGRFVTKLDVWTGVQIKLDQLMIPADVPVEAAPEAKDDKLIRQFLNTHRPAKVEAAPAKPAAKNN